MTTNHTPNYERARREFEDIARSPEARVGDRNEATTRLHLINRLLIDCLGWPLDEAIAEDRLDGRYADYKLGKPIPRFLVEAKREGIWFELPAGFDRPTCPIEQLFEGNQAIEGAIRQACSYAQERGIPIGAVSNGHQWIGFAASRQDGVPPLTGRALIFSSLDDIGSRFREFWNYLSKPGIEVLNILQALGVSPPAPPPEKLSQRLIHYPGYRNRNRLQASLQILGDFFLEDLVKAADLEQDFLRECYSPSGALSQYAVISREILRTRYSLLFQSEAEIHAQPARTKTGISGELRGDIVAASFGRRPIILLGDVGVGKSIFIRHLINVDAKDLLERALVLYVDFGSEPAFPDRLNEYVMDQFTEQLRTRYDIDIEERNFVRGVYHGELLRFERGIYSDLKEIDEAAYQREEIRFLSSKVQNRAEHLRASLDHASRGQSRQIVVFLDNVDQRPFEFQEEVFLMAQSLAETWPGTVFVALRPETFYRSRSEGSLSAYQPRVFTISPPRVDIVINKRLQFARKQLASENLMAVVGGDVLIQTDTLSRYLTVLIDSFTSRADLVEFIDNLSGGNVRVALGFIESFVGSGHVDTGKILDIVAETGRYDIPLHEFLRAVIYGNHEYYDPTASPAANLFDISTADGREHFLLPIVLAFVEKRGDVGGEEGFVGISEVYSFVQAVGFQASQVQFALRRAREKKLIEVSPWGDESAIPTRARVTTVGAYTYKRLPGMFTYVDAVIVDTPIVEESWRLAIRDATQIKDRVPRAERFRAYLDRHWRGLAGKDVIFDWPPLSEHLHQEAGRIGRSVDPENWP